MYIGISVLCRFAAHRSDAGRACWTMRKYQRWPDMQSYPEPRQKTEVSHPSPGPFADCRTEAVGKLACGDEINVERDERFFQHIANSGEGGWVDVGVYPEIEIRIPARFFACP